MHLEVFRLALGGGHLCSLGPWASLSHSQFSLHRGGTSFSLQPCSASADPAPASTAHCHICVFSFHKAQSSKLARPFLFILIHLGTIYSTPALIKPFARHWKQNRVRSGPSLSNMGQRRKHQEVLCVTQVLLLQPSPTSQPCAQAFLMLAGMGGSQDTPLVPHSALLSCPQGPTQHHVPDCGDRSPGV